MLTMTKERLYIRNASGKIMTFVGTCLKLVQFRNTILCQGRYRDQPSWNGLDTESWSC